MAGCKRERYKIEPRISVPFMLELEYESKIIKKTISGLKKYVLGCLLGWMDGKLIPCVARGPIYKTS